jgi:hypothetical protein
MSEWRNKFCKRGIVFFKFVCHWLRYVGRVVAKNSAPWQDIPGYMTIVKGVLHEMKSRRVQAYPEALKEACKALLVNENMLSAFVDILFHKTPYETSDCLSNRVYEYRVVSATLELTQVFFHTLHYDLAKAMPSNFDFQFFFNGIDRLLELDDLKGCEKCLWLLYKIVHMLPSIG